MEPLFPKRRKYAQSLQVSDEKKLISASFLLQQHRTTKAIGPQKNKKKGRRETASNQTKTNQATTQSLARGRM